MTAFEMEIKKVADALDKINGVVYKDGDDMVEKRFVLRSFNYRDLNAVIWDNLEKEELVLSIYNLVDLMNEVSKPEYTLIKLKKDILQKLDEIVDEIGDVE